MLLLSCDPTVNTPVRDAGGFFISAMSNVGQEVFAIFIKIYGGGRDFIEGGGVCGIGVVLSITEVLRTGGE
jgi:hypothetical protein